jgi:hypothetical protein
MIKMRATNSHLLVHKRLHPVCFAKLAFPQQRLFLSLMKNKVALSCATSSKRQRNAM